MAKARPRCIVIAGPNGAGKTTYLGRLNRWKKSGYRVEIVFLKLSDVEVALKRIAFRVKQGGHDVPEADVRRRFVRGWHNFEASYKVLADSWAVYDNTGSSTKLIEGSNGKQAHKGRA